MSFFALAVGAIGVGIILVISYVVIAQARSAMPTSGAGVENITIAMNSSQNTIFAGFGLLAVGIIVLGAFAMIQLWK